MEGHEKTSTVAQSTLYVLIWVEFGICTVVIALRTYSQLLIVRRPYVDDIVMLGAYALQGVASGLCTASAYWGLGSDLATLLLDQKRVVNSLKYAMISMPFGVLGPRLGRISFVLFLIATVLTVHNFRRKLLWGLIVLQIIIMSSQSSYSLRSAGRLVPKYGYFQGAFNALTDLVLIVIGVVVIIRLKLRAHTKIALSVILSLSSLAMIAAILKTIHLQLMVTSSFSYANAMWTIWFLTEGTVIIITVSIPRLRPIVVLRKKNNRSMYNNAFSNETSSRGRRSQHRFAGSGYHERPLDGGVVYPKPVKMQCHRIDSDSRELIMLKEELEGGGRKFGRS
ncbi:hypothetical protein BDV12DRAFT_201330 [Aspergillus spectabilis]